MVKKIITYIIGCIGVIGLLASIPKVWSKIPIPKSLLADKIFTQANVTIVSIGLIVASILLLKQIRSSKKPTIKEVPIYHEEDVVGFRRIKNK